MSKGWKCGNCGHEHPQTDDLAALGCYITERGVCLTRCQSCGSYVIAHRTGPHSGQFLVVKSHIKVKGKSKNEAIRTI